MDLLACPLDKSWPLKLEIIEQEIEENVNIPNVNSKTNVVCNFYCDFKKFFLVDIDENGEERVKQQEIISKHVTVDDCSKCFQTEILKGRILCSENESHIYEIKEGIPIMLTSEQIEEIYGKK